MPKGVYPHKFGIVRAIQPPEERFWVKVDKTAPGGCWLWTGVRRPNGYGSFSVRQKYFGTHRFSWELTNGPIPTGLNVLHRCDVRACVNPEHLFLGTHRDNAIDREQKGRKGKRKLTCECMRCEKCWDRENKRRKRGILVESG